MDPLRIAFFTDSYTEINGVAHTSRMLTATAKRRGVPFFLAHGGKQTLFHMEESLWIQECLRGGASFALDRDLRYDPLFYRHRGEIEERLRLFAPDVIHITGPSDVGLVGAVLAKALQVPLVASWHTNLHEYAGERLHKVTPFLPGGLRDGVAGAAEGGSMRALGWFYQLADVVMAPNPELLDLVTNATGKPGFLMRRGVDTKLFTPQRRTRGAGGKLVIGVVGRITVEKNVYFLVDLERHLLANGIGDFEIRIIGDGIERDRLGTLLTHARFDGVLRGEALAAAYADMDIFAFPSRTDTFGNVVLEALASAVPAVVTADGGPKYTVRSGESGFVAADDAAFLACALDLARDAGLRARLGARARQQADGATWDSVFGEIETAYRAAIGQRKGDPAGRLTPQ